MYFTIDNKSYAVKRRKKRKYADEYELYQGKKFICYFYQDGRTLEEAVESAINFWKKIKIISNTISKK